MVVSRGSGLHQKAALAVVELWLSVTHAGDVTCVGREYFFGSDKTWCS